MPTYAEDLNHRTLRTRLCSDGPKGCPKCRGCAFGMRYVDEVMALKGPQRRGGPVSQRVSLINARLAEIVKTMVAGVPSTELWEKSGYKNRRGLIRAIARYKKRCASLSAKQESAGAMGGAHTPPSVYHE